MDLTKEQIKEIAEELEIGFVVYINIQSKEIKSFPDWQAHEFMDEEAWQDEIEEIENNSEQYVEFEKMDSNEEFAVMEGFVETVDDLELKKKLELGLSLSKPFRNFKDIIDTGGEYRQKWFDYKQEAYIDWVITQLEHYNRSQKDMQSAEE